MRGDTVWAHSFDASPAGSEESRATLPASAAMSSAEFAYITDARCVVLRWAKVVFGLYLMAVGAAVVQLSTWRAEPIASVPAGGLRELFRALKACQNSCFPQSSYPLRLIGNQNDDSTKMLSGSKSGSSDGEATSLHGSTSHFVFSASECQHSSSFKIARLTSRDTF